MTRALVAGVTVLALGAVVGPAGAQTGPLGTTVSSSDTVHVAPPTGHKDADRASILAALERVQPGGSILFAPGTYLIGEMIRVSVPGIALLGHRQGTTLRGCDPSEEAERHAANSCQGLELTGGRQIVRNLTFEHAHFDLVVGCCVDAFRTGEVPPDTQGGGYLIEGSTFRNSRTGVRVMAGSPEPTVIRDNAFVNVFHAVGINGGTVHVLDNRVSAPEPQRVPVHGHTGGSIGVVPVPPTRTCGENVIARNRIEGHPDGITILVGVPGTSCRNNVIRDNTIIVRRVGSPGRRRGGREPDTTVVGVPLAVVNAVGDPGLPPLPPFPGFEGEAVVEANLIEGNQVIGGEGLGIELRRSSRNRILNNTITGIARRSPFPGTTMNSADPEAWREANGSGIWVSSGSEENEIVGNTFEDIAGHAVVLQGDRNVVEIRSPSDSVRDLGSGNRVSGPGGAEAHRPPDPARLAEQVMIYRDRYGVPHAHGRTDAAAVFGFMYAQAEDNLPAIERAVLRWIGRLAELEGEGAYESDLQARALEIERHARAEYGRVTPEFRAIADAWAAGLNYFRDRHAAPHRSPLTRFEPWHMFAYGNSSLVVLPSLVRQGEIRDAVRASDRSGNGSNMWMLGPSRSASGNAMLLINPHVSTSGVLNMGEGHLLSDEGLNVYGGYYFGDPFPFAGHTPRHGWALTVNSPGVASLWELTFDHAANPLAYRYGDGYRIADEWTDTLRVRTDSGLVGRTVTFRKSHHGPIVALRDGRSLAMRVARNEEGGRWQQLYAMAHARSLAEFQAAVGMLRIVFHNVGYADREGNTWYVYNGAVPRRSDRFDWNRPVDGSDREAEWQGYHRLEELPQVLNPASGWIANTNTPPFEVTAEGENPDPTRYPRYMVGEAHASSLYERYRAQRTARLGASRRILARSEPFTFDGLTAAAGSRQVFQADEDLAALLAEWRRLTTVDKTRAEALRSVLDTLAAWDRVSGLESIAMTLYTRWSVAYRTDLEDGGTAPTWGYYRLEPVDTLPWARIRALEKAVATLKRDWGTSFVAWGEMSRLQRPQGGRFSDARSSVPVAGGPGLFGIIYMMDAMPVRGQKRWYVRGGNSYLSVIEFGPQVRARTIMPFGQSADPHSPHHLDQAELFGRGEFKPAWTTLEEVRANAVRVYRPGER